MSHSLQEHNEEEFSTDIKKMIIASILVHLIIFGLIALFPSISKKPKIIKPYRVSLVNIPKKKTRRKKKQKKRVIAKKKNKKKKITKKKKPIPVKKKKKVIVSKPAEKPKEDDFWDKLAESATNLEDKWKDEDKRLAEKKKKADELKKREAEEAAERLKELQDQEEELIVADNQALPSTGNNNTVKLDSPDFASFYYLGIITDSIMENWKLPLRLPLNTNITTIVVYFRIYRRGDITDIELETSSGISELDKSAMQAVVDTNPLPPLPDDFTDQYLGVHFNFEYSNSKGA